MKRLIVIGTLVIAGMSVAAAWAGGLTQVDPSTVPQGELALETKIPTTFMLKVAGNRAHIFRGAEVTAEHDQFPPGTSTGWHSHAGPLFVQVVSGTLTVYEKNDPTCTGKHYPAGTGFLEPGFGNIHDARNETSGNVDIYVTYILPVGSGDNGLFQLQPDFSNPACPFAN
jgi:quercetin dioxygenase-like cupin family protein